MRIDFLGLQAFLSIAERGSFRRAAAHLNLSQTAISHRMRKLEDDLGLKLFARTTRSLRLTEEGEHYLLHAREALRYLSKTVQPMALHAGKGALVRGSMGGRHKGC